MFAISTKSAIKESYDEVAISSCLDSLGIAARQLLTDDVRSVSLFMAALELFCIAHLEAERARHQYDDLLVRGTYRGTILSTMQGSVKADLAELKDVLGKVCSKPLPTSQCGLLQSSVEKSKLLSSAVALMQVLGNRLAELRRRLLVRASQMLQQCDASRLATSIYMKCLNGISYTWEMAMCSLTDALVADEEIPGPLSVTDVIKCGQLLRTTNALSVSQLTDHVRKPSSVTAAALQVLLKWLPALLIHEHSSHALVLVNLHELVMNSQSMSDLLNLDEEIEDQAPGQQPQQQQHSGRIRCGIHTK